MMTASTEALESTDPPVRGLLVRGGIGGVLMGLANLVPGISGGTMLLASGIYPSFIQAIAEVSTFRFRRTSIITLMAVVGAAVLSILLFAGSVKGLVVDHRWVMYSLFIGLTLGGVPVIWNMVRPGNKKVAMGAVLGFLSMAAIAWAQATGLTGAGTNESMPMLFIAGIAGASAMILPGVSGGYLLLVLGVYVPILAGIDALKEALKARDLAAAMAPTIDVVIPVGFGVVLGVLVVSNLLKWLLTRFESLTLGGLLGFLVGAVLGLWPFQQGVAPAFGGTFKGQVVTAELLADLEPEKYPTEFFTPGPLEIGGAIGLVVLGFVATALIARVGAQSRWG